MRINSAYRLDLLLTSSTFWKFISERMNELAFLRLQNTVKIQSKKKKNGFLINREIEKVKKNHIIFKIKLLQKVSLGSATKATFCFICFCF